MAAAWTLDKVGPMTRDARDARAVLPVIATQPIEVRTRRLRVGVVDVIDPKVTDPAMAPLFAKAREVVGTFADVAPVTLPDLPTLPAVFTVLLAEIRAAFDDFIREGYVHALYDRQPWAAKDDEYAALGLRAEDYIKALRVRTQTQLAYQELFGRYDVLLTSGRTEAAPPIVGYKEPQSDAPNGFVTLLCDGNFIGAPAISTPIGLNADGLPLSLHAIAAPYDEDALLAFAEQYQARTAFHRQRPPA
jgi:Asp-tRNA(Asn)/Glu-tRNA(Gln) amidotransferase A subunit family amidase